MYIFKQSTLYLTKQDLSYNWHQWCLPPDKGLLRPGKGSMTILYDKFLWITMFFKHLQHKTIKTFLIILYFSQLYDFGVEAMNEWVPPSGSKLTALTRDSLQSVSPFLSRGLSSVLLIFFFTSFFASYLNLEQLKKYEKRFNQFMN